METESNAYRPDYAVSPGSIVAERLEAYGLSHAEFARRCGRSAKLISEIIAGKAPVEPETALQFEKVLGVDAGIWLGIETDYQLHRARIAEAKEAKGAASWIKAFPLRELVKRGIMERSVADSDTASKLLTFFGVGSVEAWQTKYERLSVAYRHSPSFTSDKIALATWLRLGELEAEQQECINYSEVQFRQALREMHGLTQAPLEEALEKVQQLGNESGVVLALVKPFPKTALSGAAWWLTPRKAVIQLSARHKTDDHLWFSLFHEAAHILLHSKKRIFIDGTQADEESTDIETEANQWAANFLIPPNDWKQFVATSLYDESTVRQFAEEQGIAPGIVVGRLQHEKHIPWNQLNTLKVRLKWEITA